MKVVLDRDILLYQSPEGVEVGSIPKGVGLERLRYDGGNIIDLMDLDQFWIREIDGNFELHCVQVPDSQLVKIKYPDRKYLINDNGIIREATNEELLENHKQIEKNKLKNKLRIQLKKEIGDRDDQIADLAKILSFVISYLIKNDMDALEVLKRLEPKLSEIYKPAETGLVLQERAEGLSAQIKEYFIKKGGI